MKKEMSGGAEIQQKTVLFVEQTRKGELASDLRALLLRLVPTLKFGVKVVERTGSSLRSHFSQGSLWHGLKCGRGEDCVPCNQGAEEIPPCTRVSALYENFCTICNPGAKESKEVKAVMDTPSLYVGETSRSLQERFKEHHEDLKKKSEKSHMWYIEYCTTRERRLHSL